MVRSREYIARLRHFLYKRGEILFVSLLIIFVAIAINYTLIGTNEQYIYNLTSDSELAELPEVAIVLGGGIEAGQPKPLLKDRLDTAAKLLADGKVQRLLLSGDNRFSYYNEPEVMRKYLLNQKMVDENLLTLDEAGRSTYETCERAKKIYSLQKVLLISESTHLPRAIYLCRSFGIEAYGYASDGKSSSGLKIGQRWRELLARTKATVNVYTIGEKTVLGDPIIITHD
jgi:SanA protein